MMKNPYIFSAIFALLHIPALQAMESGSQPTSKEDGELQELNLDTVPREIASMIGAYLDPSYVSDHIKPTIPLLRTWPTGTSRHALCPEGKHVAICSGEEIVFYDTGTGEELVRIKASMLDFLRGHIACDDHHIPLPLHNNSSDISEEYFPSQSSPNTYTEMFFDEAVLWDGIMGHQVDELDAIKTGRTTIHVPIKLKKCNHPLTDYNYSKGYSGENGKYIDDTLFTVATTRLKVHPQPYKLETQSTCYPVSQDTISSFALNPQGTLCAVFSLLNAELTVYDIPNKKVVFSKQYPHLIPEIDDNFPLVFNADGTLLAMGNAHQIEILETKNFTLHKTLYSPIPEASEISGLSWCRDGKYLAVITDNTIHILDAHSGAWLATIPSKDTNMVGAVTFSPDNSALIAGPLRTGTTKLYDIRNLSMWHNFDNNAKPEQDNLMLLYALAFLKKLLPFLSDHPDTIESMYSLCKLHKAFTPEQRKALKPYIKVHSDILNRLKELDKIKKKEQEESNLITSAGKQEE